LPLQAFKAGTIAAIWNGNGRLAPPTSSSADLAFMPGHSQWVSMRQHIHVITIRWAKVRSLDAFEDSEAVR
jgi:hypothetical protein